jgi:3' terminal RNA ribose 2'-O-methyltransferase Hen1
VGLRLAGEMRLADLLNHLYVLLPVLDDDKHYWVDEAEIEKLLRLLERLIREDYELIVGADVSVRALEQAARRAQARQHHDAPRQRITLLHSALTYRDRRLAGFDAAALVEVIEHLDPARLAACEQNVFGSARQGTVVVTTPNVEYNVRWETLPAGQLRHPDHRFEWSRAEFAAWAHGVCERHGYTVRYLPVGPEDAEVGPPTQMAVFSR